MNPSLTVDDIAEALRYEAVRTLIGGLESKEHKLSFHANFSHKQCLHILNFFVSNILNIVPLKA